MKQHKPPLGQRMVDPVASQAAPLDPEDGPLHRSERRQFRLSMLGGAFSGLVFALVYALFSEVWFSAILVAIALVSLLLLILLRLGRLRFSQVHFLYLATNLLGNFLATLALGGIATSTGAFLYILGTPFGAITRPAREFMRWFGASIVLVLLEALLQPWLRQGNNIPSQAVPVLWGLNFAIVCSFLFANLRTLLRQRDQALQSLRIEQEKSETLLLNVLPRKIALRLKEAPGTVAEAHPAATILFADIVGFTPLSTFLSPEEMIGLLNQIYTHFDALADKYRVEKIRTIGDNYMAACGVPEADANHAINAAAMALEMQAYAEQLPPRQGHKIQFRIGIHSGPLIAGIVGKSKFQYDIWGDAVNTASRMESHGEPGKIQVSRATYLLLKDQFRFEARGTVRIKGKGPLETWFLIGRRSDAGSPQE